MSAYQNLQQKHPTFIYDRFAFSLTDQSDLVCHFYYQLENGPQFDHQVIYHQVPGENFRHQSTTLLSNLVFHLGLIEAFSYWKLTASPVFQINCGYLNKEQVKFWQNLLLHGMGEYFYINQIEDFFQQPPTFTVPTAHHSTPIFAAAAHTARTNPLTALGIGGGKDSAVMTTLFQKSGLPFVNLILQPASPAATKMATLNGQPTFTVSRHFDPQLFALNKQNYLNGHVPFSAIFAFISTLAAVLYDFDYIAVGNENSANQPSLIWHNHPINHQFSKSTKFEQDFQKYSSQYLLRNVHYYSLIRPFSELKVAQIFCTNPTFFPIFKSCNRGQQQDHWCENCPKCLFVFLMLAPFLEEQILTSQIFSHNLLDDQNLLPTLRQLLGLDPTKPLECVGTVEESQLAFHLLWQKYQHHASAVASQPPRLLSQLALTIESLPVDWVAREHQLLDATFPHHLPPSVRPLLKLI